MTTLRFRLPGRSQPLGAWLAVLLPALDRAARRRLIEEGRIRLDGRAFDRPKKDCPPGAFVEIDWDGGRAEALPDSAPESPCWMVWVEAPAWAGGTLPLGAKGSLEFVRREVRGDLVRLEVTGPGCRAPEVCAALSNASMPVVGDLLGGGLAAPGGARIGATTQTSLTSSAGGSDETDVDSLLDWPDEKVWRDSATAGDPEPVDAGDFSVSEETARAIRGGHPWILPDDASDPASRFRPGTLVRVTKRGAKPIGWALIEGTSRIAARLWAEADAELRKVPSVEARVAQAIARRRDLLGQSGDLGTDAFRLVHGEGDGLPGIFVDRLGALLRVLVSGRAAMGIRTRVVGALLAQLPVTPEGQPWSVLELLHLRSAGAHQVDRVCWLQGGRDALGDAGAAWVGEGYWVRERGLRYSVDPGWDAPRQPRPGYGLFVDQRENRARLAPAAAEGGEWLNLFAHTGAFSVSLLAAGAERVVSVDLSGPYLARLEGNLHANLDRGVDPARHETVRGDVRHYLESLDPALRFRGMVIDPPTAAAAGRRFWSVKQDLEPLLAGAIAHLDDGGTLLVTQNRSGPELGLDRVIEPLLEREGRSVADLQRAPAGTDHPALRGFPEGDPFEGWLVTLK